MAFVACYAAPWLGTGLLLSALWSESGELSGWRLAVFNLYYVVYFVAMPLAAGYFTARFAKNRPQLHVVLVVALGVFALSFVRSSSATEQAVVAGVSLAMASVGAFIFLRGRGRET